MGRKLDLNPLKQIVKDDPDTTLLDSYRREDGSYLLTVDLTGGSPFEGYGGKRFLDAGIFDYIDSLRQGLDPKEKVEIAFLVEKRDEEEERLIEEAFRRHYKIELNGAKTSRRRMKVVSLFLLVVGSLLIGLYLGLSFGTQSFVWEIIAEVVSIASWVFVWAAVEKFCFGLPEKKRDAYYYASMSMIGVSFISKGDEK